MKYNEWNTSQDSIFYELNELAPNSIISILGVEQLNLYYAITFGSREIVSTLQKVNTSAVAQMIHNIHMQKWVRLSEIYLNDLKIGFDSSSTIETTNTDKSNKDITTNNTQQVSAYNDDELSNVSGEIDSLKEKGERENITKVITTNINLKSIDFQRALLENSNITNIICNDIASLLSLAVY